jgi:hypothetical protein
MQLAQQAWRNAMKLIARNKRPKFVRIPITQAEITADLLYPGGATSFERNYAARPRAISTRRRTP